MLNKLKRLLTVALPLFRLFVVVKRLEVLRRLVECNRMLPQTILQLFAQAVPHRHAALAAFQHVGVLGARQLRCGVRRGEATGEAVRALPEGVVNVATFADVGGLVGQVGSDVVVEVALVAIGTFAVALTRSER